MQELLPKLIGIFGAVFLFGFAIFIHELGHFLAAKWSGVGVSKFAIGFGPKIVSFRRGGTEYSIRWIPLGGFVALKGMIEGLDDEPGGEKPGGEKPDGEKPENEPEEKISNGMTDDLDALRNKHPLIKILVFFAGVFFNYLSAIVMMVVLLAYGMPKGIEYPPAIGKVAENSQLHRLGWRSEDRILAVAPQLFSGTSTELSGALAQTAAATTKTAAWGQTGDYAHLSEVHNAIQTRLPERPSPGRFRTLSFLRDKLLPASDDDEKNNETTTKTLLITVSGKNAEEQRTLPLPIAYLADPEVMRSFTPTLPAVIAAVAMTNSPAGRALLVQDNWSVERQINSLRPYPAREDMKREPIKAGDKILAVNDNPVADWDDLVTHLRAQPDQSIHLVVEREQAGKKRIMLLATTLERNEENLEWGHLGIQADRPHTDERDGLPLWDSLLRAPMATLEFTDLVLFETVRLFATSSGAKIKQNLAGPVAIVTIAYQSARRGLAQYLLLFIQISIILAILNLMPIPILDGGYICITIIEAIIRRPVPQKILTPLLTTFMLLFFLLFAFIFFNDFMNLIYRF